MLIENSALRDRWHVVAEVGDVAGGAVGVTLLGDDYVLWTDPEGRVCAAPDRCPHREAPLSLGVVVDGCLGCAYHGWKFGAGGRCVEVPSCGPGKAIPPRAHLVTVHVEQRYGLVWLCPGDPTNSGATIPTMPAETNPAYRRINSGVEVWQTSATRMTDNFLDISHFPYVHVGTFGLPDERDVAPIELEQLDDGFYGYAYEVDVSNEQGAASSGLDEAVITRRMTTGFHLPFTVRSAIHYETGLDHLILLCTTPIDDETSYFTFVIWRNDDFSVPAEETIAFDRAIGAEDKLMLERIRGTLSLDQQATVSVQADKPSVEWRRRLRELMVE